MPRSERASDLGITIGRFPHGPRNAISDVSGVRVATETLIAGDGALLRGRGPIRTGVTAILPQALESMGHPLFAGTHRLNGNGRALSGFVNQDFSQHRSASPIRTRLAWCTTR
jgi:L-aminopeptidase/D-esterase-like protein